MEILSLYFTFIYEGRSFIVYFVSYSNEKNILPRKSLWWQLFLIYLDISKYHQKIHSQMQIFLPVWFCLKVRRCNCPVYICFAYRNVNSKGSNIFTVGIGACWFTSHQKLVTDFNHRLSSNAWIRFLFYLSVFTSDKQHLYQENGFDILETGHSLWCNQMGALLVLANYVQKAMFDRLK